MRDYINFHVIILNNYSKIKNYNRSSIVNDKNLNNKSTFL